MPIPPAQMINGPEVRRKLSSHSIPIKTNYRDGTEEMDLRQREDEADYCDYCVYRRIVDGLIRRNRLREYSSTPPKNSGLFLETINSIIRTRHASLSEDGFEDTTSMFEEEHPPSPEPHSTRLPRLHVRDYYREIRFERCPYCATQGPEYRDDLGMCYHVQERLDATPSTPEHDEQIFAMDL